MSQVSNVIQFLRLDAEPSQVPVSPDAWDDLAVAAIALGFAPLLHVKTQGMDLPSATRAKLAVTYAATQRRNFAIAGQLAELLAACAAAGIDAMVLKGGYLAFAVYPDPALRGMSDLDLFFRPGDLGRAEAVLESLGYQGKHKSADEGPGIVKHTSTYKRESIADVAGTPNPYLSTAGDRHVDPHGSLEESWFGLRVDVTPGVWQRSRQTTLVDRPAYAMSTEDLLLQLSVHLVFHLLMGKPSLVQLYDIAFIGQALSVDWTALLDRSRERRAVPFLYAALHLAEQIFAAPLPDGVLTQLQTDCPVTLARHIQAMGLPDVMQQTQRPPLLTVRQRLTRGISDRRQTALWATTWQGKWAVWQTAVDIGRTDTGKLIGERVRTRLGLAPRHAS